MVLPSGVFRYKFIVDGEVRYIPDLPSESDEMGHVCNLLDVHVSEYFSPDTNIFHPKSVVLVIRKIDVELDLELLNYLRASPVVKPLKRFLCATSAVTSKLKH